MSDVATEPSRTPSPTPEQLATAIPYLAYGSNLAKSTFQGRRGIKPLSSHVVFVPSLSLVFDLPGIPYLEPRFANVKLNASDENESKETTVLLKSKQNGYSTQGGNDQGGDVGLYGVVYYVTPKDYAKIVATEGGGTSYQDVTVDCIVLSASALSSFNSSSHENAPDGSHPGDPERKVIQAHTLLAPRSKTRETDPQGHPSPRYLNLLVSGAKEHRMPPVWQEYLSSLPTYTATTIRQKVGRVLFMGLWMPLFITFFTIGRVVVDKEGRAPSWWGSVMNGVFKVVWASYDCGFRSLFGEGERGLEKTSVRQDEVWEVDEVEAVEDAVEGGLGGQ